MRETFILDHIGLSLAVMIVDATMLARLLRAGELTPVWSRTPTTRRCATWFDCVVSRGKWLGKPGNICKASYSGTPPTWPRKRLADGYRR
jgi:hypothetical protein